jgi:hypothetical protein
MKSDKLSAFLKKYGVGGILENPNSDTPNVNLRLPSPVNRTPGPIGMDSFIVNTPNHEFIGGVSPMYRGENISMGPYATFYSNPQESGIQDVGVRGSVKLGKRLSVNADVSPQRTTAGLRYGFKDGGSSRKLKKYQGPQASQVGPEEAPPELVKEYESLNEAINAILAKNNTTQNTGKTPIQVKDYLMSTSIGDFLGNRRYNLDQSCTGPYCATAGSVAMYETYPNSGIHPTTGGDNFRDMVLSNPAFGITSEDIYSKLSPGSLIQNQVLRSTYTDPVTKKLKYRSVPSYQSAHNYYVYDVKELENGRKRAYTVQNPGSGPQILKEYDIDKEGNLYRPDTDDIAQVSGRLKGQSRPALMYYKGQDVWSNPELNELISKRQSIKDKILESNPKYFDIPVPTRFDTDYTPGAFMSKYSTSDQGPYVINAEGDENINLSESRIPEILNQVNDPEYKKMIMKDYNISNDEYNAMIKTMMGQYMMESQGGTDYQSGLKLPENKLFSYFMPNSWVWNKSLGPFQMNYGSLSDKTRKLYPSDERDVLDFIYDPVKSSDIAMRFLAENVSQLRNRAKSGNKENLTQENYLDFLPYLINQQGWLARSDKSSRKKKGSILGEGVNKYVQGVKYYGDQLVDYVPMNIDPVEIKAAEQQRDGGITSSKAKEMLRDGSVHGHPLTDKQKRYFGWIAGGKKRDGGSLPMAQTGLPKVLTYANAPEYFDNRAVYSDNPQYNDIIRKFVYAGTHGFNPQTGELVKLDTPVSVPKDVRRMANQTGPSGAQESFNRNMQDPEFRKKLVETSTAEAYQNPLMYAPGSIGMAMLPPAWGSAYGFGLASTQLAQGDYGTAGLTAGLSALPFVPSIVSGFSNQVMPRVLQSDIAKRLMSEEALRNRVVSNINLTNFQKYNPDRIGGGGYGQAYSLRKFPELVLKVSPSERARETFATTARFEDIPQYPNQIYPRYFKSAKDVLGHSHPEFEPTTALDYEVMSRIPGVSARKLTGQQMSEIPLEAYSELRDQVDFLRRNDVGIDFQGDNLMYDPGTKRFGLIDLSPEASKSAEWAKSNIFKQLSNTTPELEARGRIRDILLDRFKNQFGVKNRELRYNLANQEADLRMMANQRTVTPPKDAKVIYDLMMDQMKNSRSATVDPTSPQNRLLLVNSILNDPAWGHPLLNELDAQRMATFKNINTFKQKGGTLTQKQKEYFGWIFQ